MSGIAVTPEDAFEVLQVFLQEKIAAVQEGGADAMRAGDYTRAQQTIKQARTLDELLKKLQMVEDEYNRLVEGPEHRVDYSRLRKGLRTPDHEYYRPILESLSEMGGSGVASDVLHRVFEKMQIVLNSEVRPSFWTQGIRSLSS